MTTKTKRKSSKKTKPSFGSAKKTIDSTQQEDSPAIKALLESGVAFHNKGNMQQALDSYKSVLAMAPGHPDANHLLGILMNQTGDSKSAILLIRKAIEKKPTAAKFHNNLGLAYKLDRRTMEAASSFRKAINLDLAYAGPYLNLAQLLTEEKKYTDAIKQYEIALELATDKSGVLTKLSSSYLEQGNIPKALENAENASSYLLPHFMEILHREMDSVIAASDEVKTLFKIGIIFQLFSMPYYAGLCMIKAIALDPNCAAAYGQFTSIASAKIMPTKNNIHAALIEKTTSDILARNDMKHDTMRDQVISIIDIEGAKADIDAFTITSDENALSFIQENQRLLEIFSTHCFLQLLKSSSINNLLVEKLLTKIRRCLFFAMLHQDSPSQLTDQFGPLIISLAYQNFLNEYVFFIDQDELFSIDAFEEKAKNNISDNTSDAILYVAMLACYRSLEYYPTISEMISNRQTPSMSDIEGLITLQITNPKKEKEIAKSIKQFKVIENITSKLVRQQYEENPYPRWASTFRLPPKSPRIIIAKGIYPNLPDDSSTLENPRVLIAGCGTGQHPISCAVSYANSSVLAVDLSLASLSYAQRKADELNLNNIEFMQADILDLGGLNEQFDIIESSGVLHHMKEPIAGWKVLEKLLKPNGMMKIGLYSELARANVVASRNIIAEQHYPSTPEGIRECREYIKGLDDNNIVKSVIQWNDFFSTSMIRDLIFHSMEHRITLPQIDKILSELNLEFMGFCVFNGDCKSRYLEQFPDDKTATSLTNWHTFETQFPNTFKGMYQFWLRKKAP
ncbi:MAG: hypothetical protein COA99_02190 [Moraxellaceae bacterium]|nr:MAG: hypothetical protein COA99_02190 [Moraxellaceae bacterium]